LLLALVLALSGSLTVVAAALGFGQVPGSPFATEEHAESVGSSANGALLALANRSKDTVSVFSVNQSTGALTQVGGSPVAVGGEPLALAFTPAGYSVHELAVTRGDGKVAVFTVNESSGALSPVAGSPFTVGGKNEGASPLTLAFSPTLQLVAVAETNEHFVPIYEINSKTGAWKFFAGIGGDSPTSVSWSVGGGLLAVANGLDNAVRIFRLEASSLFETTQVLGSDPSAVAFSPAGKGTGASTLAIANQTGNSVSMVNFNEASGEAFPVSGSPFGAGSAPSSLAFNPSGGLLAVANEGGNNLSLFSVNAETDVLTQVPESPFAAGSAPVQVAFSPAGEAGLLAVAHLSAKEVSVFASAHPSSVSAVTPNIGSAAGGTSVTITGSSFLGTSAVKFGSLNAASFKVDSATSITVVAPASPSPGAVYVTITAPGGSAAGGTSAAGFQDLFTYEPPGPPEFGNCVKVAKGSGEYENAGCTKAKARSLYDWTPFAEGFHEAEAEASAPFVLETVGKSKLECAGAFYSGWFEPPKKAFNAGISAGGCSGGCAVQQYPLEGFLMVEKNVAGKPPKIAMDLYAQPRGEGRPLWEIKCGSSVTLVRGALLVPVPSTDKTISRLTLKWVATKGKQKPERVEGGPREVLEESTNGGPWQQAGLTFTTKLLIRESETFEINARR